MTEKARFTIVGIGTLPMNKFWGETGRVRAATAVVQERPAAGEAVERLNGLLLLVPNVETGDDPSLVGPFIVARWRESQGDLEGALAAMRRWR